MKKLLMIAVVCLICSLWNLLTVFVTGSGISLVLGIFWLAGSGYVFVQYRKMKKSSEEEEKA